MEGQKEERFKPKFHFSLFYQEGPFIFRIEKLSGSCMLGYFCVARDHPDVASWVQLASVQRAGR